MDVSQVAMGRIMRWVETIRAMDLDAMARGAGLFKRKPRKLRAAELVAGILAVALVRKPSLERIAGSIARCLGEGYSKQALAERLEAGAGEFLFGLCAARLASAGEAPGLRGLFARFGRVLVQDSTTIPLHDRHADEYPGSANQRKSGALMKIQTVFDLVAGAAVSFGISGFTRNDQSAAPDILGLLRPGDLVLRDLGYFVLDVLARIARAGAFFLTRLRHGTTVIDPDTGGEILLDRVLRAGQSFDRPVLLGRKARVPVRLIAVPVSDKLANRRRRLARANRDRRLRPSPARLRLLGWSIFVTNVPADVWTPEQAAAVYRLRWSIEIVFKAWKSGLDLAEVNDRSLPLLRLTIAARLLFCAFATQVRADLEAMNLRPGRQVSLLRVTRLLAAMQPLIEAAILGLTLNELLTRLLSDHAFHEKRKDRTNLRQDILHALAA